MLDACSVANCSVVSEIYANGGAFLVHPLCILQVVRSSVAGCTVSGWTEQVAGETMRHACQTFSWGGSTTCALPLVAGGAFQGGMRAVSPESDFAFEPASILVANSVITRCIARNPRGGAEGGAFSLFNPNSLSLVSCSISDCSAVGSDPWCNPLCDGWSAGGAISCQGSLRGGEAVVVLTDTIVSCCSALGSANLPTRGGALDIFASYEFQLNVSVTNCTVTDCSAVSPLSPAAGGAICSNGGVHFGVRLSLVDSAITHCRANSSFKSSTGGGLCLLSANVSLVSSVIQHCTAESSTGAASGGALYLSSSRVSAASVSLEHCTASTTYGEASGGASFHLYCKASFYLSLATNCNASSSSNAASGGAFSCFTSTISLESSSVVRCTASSSSGLSAGGAMHLASSSSASLVNSPVTLCVAQCVDGDALGGVCPHPPQDRTSASQTWLPDLDQ